MINVVMPDIFNKVEYAGDPKDITADEKTEIYLEGRVGAACEFSERLKFQLLDKYRNGSVTEQRIIDGVCRMIDAIRSDMIGDTDGEND